MQNCWEVNNCTTTEGLNCPARQMGKSCWMLRKCFHCKESGGQNSCKVYREHKVETLILVDKAQHGDEEAAEKLISIYSRFIFQAEKKFFIPGGTREDLRQEGFIGLFMAIKTYDIRRDLPFEDYASLSIRNSILRAVRSATQKKRLLLTRARSIDEDFNILKEIADSRNPEDIVLGRIEAEKLKRFIDSNLSGSERIVLKLKVANYSVDEIVDIADEDKKRVENALYRGRKKIKAHFRKNHVNSYFSREDAAQCG